MLMVSGRVDLFSARWTRWADHNAPIRVKNPKNNDPRFDRPS
jgi:hypothetical protein